MLLQPVNYCLRLSTRVLQGSAWAKLEAGQSDANGMSSVEVSYTNTVFPYRPSVRARIYTLMRSRQDQWRREEEGTACNVLRGMLSAEYANA